MRTVGIVAVIVTVLLTQTVIAADEPPAYIVAAVANVNRPDIDKARDIDRKPAEVIAFADIKPGDKIADLMPGSGYFTRIFCSVVGDNGHVYAVTVSRNTASNTSASTQSSSSSTQNTNSSPGVATNVCTNVTRITLKAINQPAPELHSDSDDPGWVYEYYHQSAAAENFKVPEPLDVIWTSENYHDLHNASFGMPDMQRVNKAFFAALKSGGMLMIEDHAAAPDSGARDTSTLHRIDPALVKKEVTAAGFVFVAASEVLHHADDPHTSKAHDMHDKTDRFLLKFRKP